MTCPRRVDTISRVAMTNIEIFILNYNGSSFLVECLNSLQELDLSEMNVCIVVADNASTDSSAGIVAEYPGVIWLPLGRNWGFAQGNNVAVAKRTLQRKLQGVADPDYLIFLNNDVEVDAGWLKALLAPLIESESIGLVGAKAVFYDSFVRMQISTKPLPGSLSSEPLYPHIGLAIGDSSYPAILKKGRIKCVEGISLDQAGGWCLDSEASCLIPVYHDSQTEVTFILSAEHSEVGALVSFEVAGEVLMNVKVEARKQSEVSLQIPKGAARTFIQNAGSFVRRGLIAGDRGFMEEDCGQFEKVEDVAAICGASLAIRAGLFKRLGGFSKDYFAYYEDIDLSLRARLAGYRCVYAPSAILKHVHAGSGVEGSFYFNQTVAQSRTMFLSRYASSAHFWGRCFKELLLSLQELLSSKKELAKSCPHSCALLNSMGKSPQILKNRLLYWAKFYFWRIPKLLE